jgi:uncharacterized protein YggU (UPF0235/DUF167 family)
MGETSLVAAVDEHGSTLEIWVRPGASRSTVGGEHAGALAVAVTAKAVDGAATDAALAAVAGALGVSRRQVWLLRGATGRRKLLGVELSREDLDRRLADLLAPPSAAGKPSSSPRG